MNVQVVGHPRSGTHLLAKLLFQNFETGAEKYSDLCMLHSRIPEDGSPFVCVIRAALPTMMSLWRIRERVGIASSVSFSDMIRLPWTEMPRAESCDLLFDGVEDKATYAFRDFDGTVLERWLQLSRVFRGAARISFRYEDLINKPRDTCSRIKLDFGLERKYRSFQLVLERVGYSSREQESIQVKGTDVELCELYTEMLG